MGRSIRSAAGSLGGFSQYDIGSNLAELELYKTEVAWGNGTATDAEYIDALTKARDATSTGTKDRETAQNRLDDAVYRIDRQKAQQAGSRPARSRSTRARSRR